MSSLLSRQSARGCPGFVIWSPSYRLKGHRDVWFFFFFFICLFTAWRWFCWSTSTEPGVHHSPSNMTRWLQLPQACHSTNLHLCWHACFIYIQLDTAAPHTEGTQCFCFRWVYYRIIVEKGHSESLYCPYITWNMLNKSWNMWKSKERQQFHSICPI